MTFPARAVEIVLALYLGVNPQDDTARRIAIQRTCEQVVFELGAQWGNKKRAGLSDDFRSPDSIAYLEPSGAVSVWDIQLSSGAIDVHEGKLATHPNLPPSEAAFMPCAPVNHLSTLALPIDNLPPPIDNLPPPIVNPIDLSRLETKVDVLTERLIAHESAESAERQAAAQYREAVRTKWSRFWKGAMKVGWKLAPVIGGLLAGVIGS
mgnify:CR=1 FL=1